MTHAPDAQSPSPPELRAALRDAFSECRQGTLALFEGMTESEFREPVHREFSPLGWHLGHIAYTEALWLVGRCGGQPLPRPELEAVYHVDALPKAERSRRIPDLETCKAYASEIRETMFDCLDTAPVDEQERLWRFVLQHEAQHTETVRLLMALREAGEAPAPEELGAEEAGAGAPALEWVSVAGGLTLIGNDAAAALDNEQPRHRVRVDNFEIGRHPVTQGQFAAFMADGGYRRREFWGDAGWAWLRAGGVAAPLYWRPGDADLPVCGVSAWEAEAFCRWAGARLPSEFEWEAAAQLALDAPDARLDRLAPAREPIAALGAGDRPEHMTGQVWEWTSSLFAPYPGFQPFPYAGYSQTYFDGEHRVLRGGSWATRPWARRASFRNWYTPDTRQIFAGFRCARDAAPGGRS